MILTCPECETQYFADDSSIGESGRTVKCASCGHSWFVEPVQAESPGARRAGAHETYRARVRERRRRKSRFAAVGAWTLTSALAVIALAGIIVFRDDIANTWPQSASAFRLAGLDVNRFRIEFIDAEAERFFDGTTPILEVRGAVLNISSSEITAPRVRVALLDDTGEAIAESFARVEPDSIGPEETGQFAVRIENPPYEAFELDLSLAPVDTADTDTGSELP